jgi:transposase
MDQCIMIGCDLPDENMLLKVAVDREAPEQRSFRNDRRGREELRRYLCRLAEVQRAGRVIFAYEASGQGYQFYDELPAAGVECYVLAPSRLSASPHARKRKTDERDAERILEAVRAHVLAGNTLPSVWVPDTQTRADRELVRVLVELCGVGVLTALVFLTELGDLSRFQNRRQIGADLGLVPSSDESGERQERKGHITHQGSSRLRKVLCQAVWSRLRADDPTRAVSERIAQGDRRRKKVAVVALMRRLAIVMWHSARAAQERSGCFPAAKAEENGKEAEVA